LLTVNLNLTTYDTNECRQDTKCVNKSFNYGSEGFSTPDDKTFVRESRECNMNTAHVMTWCE